METGRPRDVQRSVEARRGEVPLAHTTATFMLHVISLQHSSFNTFTSTLYFADFNNHSFTAYFELTLNCVIVRAERVCLTLSEMLFMASSACPSHHAQSSTFLR